MASTMRQVNLAGEIVEDLNNLDLQHYLARALKKLREPPVWLRWEKAAIAWGICFDGYVDAENHEVGLGVTDEGLMDAWWELVKHFGNRTSYRKGGDGLKWRVQATREVLYLLAQIYPYMPDKRKRAKAVMDYCVQRIREEEEVMG